MEDYKKEAPATASTPEQTNKGTENKANSKVLKPKFDSLTAQVIKEHVAEKAKLPGAIEHDDILNELLQSIDKFDFEKAAFPEIEELRKKYFELQQKELNPDGSLNPDRKFESQLKDIKKKIDACKLTQKIYAIKAVENVINVAIEKSWGICINNYFIYLYNGEYWANIDKERFQVFLGEAAERMGVIWSTSRWHQFREVLFKQFVATSYFSKPKRRKNTTLINLRNGTFEIKLEGQKLRPFDRNDFLTYQLPFEYNPDAKAPLFERYLQRVQPDIERQKVLAEFLGYVFVSVKTLKLEKALVLYGGGANGKSVFFEVVNALLGDENVSGYSLESLTDKEGYHRAMIIDKLVNYASELNANQLATDKTKQLISGEKIQARLPYGDPFDITDYAKLIFNANELPKNAEQTNAYFRRFMIVNFEQTIPEEEQDKELSKKIIESELSGVFNWVIDGLNRLLEQKKFTVCKAVNEARKQYELESDSVNQFIVDSGYIASPDSYETLPNLYREYRAFCIEDGCHFVKKGNFKKRLMNLNFVFSTNNQGNIVCLKKHSNPF